MGSRKYGTTGSSTKVAEAEPGSRNTSAAEEVAPEAGNRWELRVACSVFLVDRPEQPRARVSTEEIMG